MREMKTPGLKPQDSLRTNKYCSPFAEGTHWSKMPHDAQTELSLRFSSRLASTEIEIIGGAKGLVEVAPCRTAFRLSCARRGSQYLAWPGTTSNVSPSPDPPLRRLRPGDTIEGPIRSPKEGRALFRLLKGQTYQLRRILPKKGAPATKINCDNLDPALSRKRRAGLKMGGSRIRPAKDLFGPRPSFGTILLVAADSGAKATGAP